jgi:hypothetical protein
MIFRLLITVFLTVILNQNVIAHDRYDIGGGDDYGGGQGVVKDKKWTAGDTFLAIAIPTTIVGVIILLNVYGEPEDTACWPVQKFTVFNNIEQPQIIYKFPTRSL